MVMSLDFQMFTHARVVRIGIPAEKANLTNNLHSAIT